MISSKPGAAVASGPETRPSGQPTPEELDAYVHLTREEIARLVLCLMIEEALASQLASWGIHVRRPTGGGQDAA